MTDTVQLYLSDDYYEHENWQTASPSELKRCPDAVFDVPVEQRDRWQAAMDAYAEMQGEIGGYLTARREERRAREAVQRQREAQRESLLVRPWRKG